MHTSQSIKTQLFRRCWTTLALELQTEVFMYLTLAELVVLGDIEPYSALAYSVLITRLNDVFEVWDLCPVATFRMMTECNTILSGSFALYLAFISTWFPADLDFYCPVIHYETVVAFFLKRKYTLLPKEEPVGTAGPYQDVDGIGEVATLAHASRGLKINVISSLSSSPCTPILFFHSTVVMNVITPTGIVSFYPEATSNRKGIRNHCRVPKTRDWNVPQPREAGALAKYKERGYAISDDCEHRYLTPRASCDWCSERFRFSDDTAALRMSFTRGEAVVLAPAFRWKMGTLRTWRENALLYEVPPKNLFRRHPGEVFLSDLRHVLVYCLPGDNTGPRDNLLLTVRVYERLDLRLPHVVVEGSAEDSEWSERTERRLVDQYRRID